MELPTVPLTPLMLTAQGCPEGHVPRLAPRISGLQRCSGSARTAASTLTVGPGYARDPDEKKLARPRARSPPPSASALDTFHLSGRLPPRGSFLALFAHRAGSKEASEPPVRF